MRPLRGGRGGFWFETSEVCSFVHPHVRLEPNLGTHLAPVISVELRGVQKIGSVLGGADRESTAEPALVAELLVSPDAAFEQTSVIGAVSGKKTLLQSFTISMALFSVVLSRSATSVVSELFDHVLQESSGFV